MKAPIDKLVCGIKRKLLTIEEDIATLFVSIKEGKIPLPARIMTFVSLAYFLSPIDLIPDFIPILGYLDDLIVLPALIYTTIKLIPKSELERCRSKRNKIRFDDYPRRWYYAIPIVFFWLVLVVFLWKMLYVSSNNE